MSAYGLYYFNYVDLKRNYLIACATLATMQGFVTVTTSVMDNLSIASLEI